MDVINELVMCFSPLMFTVLLPHVCKQLHIYQAIDEQELQDVQQHPPKRDLQRPQVRVGCEQRDEAKGTENVGNGKHCFSY